VPVFRQTTSSARPPPHGARPVQEAKVGGRRLADAIDFIRDGPGTTITVNWKAGLRPA